MEKDTFCDFPRYLVVVSTDYGYDVIEFDSCEECHSYIDILDSSYDVAIFRRYYQRLY